MTTKEMEKEMLKENQLIFKKLVKKNVEEGKLEAFNLGKREVFISTSEPRWLRDWIKEGAKMGLFKNIHNNFEATRYHSLVVDRNRLPKSLLITAETKNKTIMGLMHKDYDIHGFQFHPESISTKVGMKLIKNFIIN